MNPYEAPFCFNLVSVWWLFGLQYSGYCHNRNLLAENEINTQSLVCSFAQPFFCKLYNGCSLEASVL